MFPMDTYTAGMWERRVSPPEHALHKKQLHRMRAVGSAVRPKAFGRVVRCKVLHTQLFARDEGEKIHPARG